MNEEWKPIAGYEGLYEVSNIGRVRSLDAIYYKIHPTTCTTYPFNIRGRVLKQTDSGKGYMIVQLYKDKVRKNHYVHRLVGDCFVTGYHEGAEINHKDMNRNNNVYTNLEWTDRRGNLLYSDIPNRANKNNRVPVSMYNFDGTFIKTFKSVKQASKETNIASTHIIDVCKGRYYHSGGYIWRYANN